MASTQANANHTSGLVFVVNTSPAGLDRADVLPLDVVLHAVARAISKALIFRAEFAPV
jgi:hypothetical protein